MHAGLLPSTLTVATSLPREAHKQKLIEFKSIYKNPVRCQKIGFDPVGEAFRLPKDRKQHEWDLGDFRWILP